MMKKDTIHAILGLTLLLCLTPISSSRAADAPQKASGPSDDRLARHALGRADLAERMGLCFQDQAANLRGIATNLLHAKTKRAKDSYRKQLQTAHQALTSCLDLSPMKCTKSCSPLPSASVTEAPFSQPASQAKKGKVRTKIIAVDNGGIQDDKTSAGTGEMRQELHRGIAGKDLPLRSCYRTALKRDPDLTGMAAYRLVFGPDGRVTKTQLLSTTLANISLARCALKPLGALHLSSKKIPDQATAIVRLVFSTNP